MNKKFEFNPPVWRLYDLESGKLIAQDKGPEQFWGTVITSKGVNLSNIEGFYIDG